MGLFDFLGARRTESAAVGREPVFVPRPHAEQPGASAAHPRLLSPGEAFTPTHPKTSRRRLIGREAELRRIMQALQEDQAHVVLYSERGRGKTSLANMVVESLRRTDVIVARHTCEAGTTFDNLIRGLMQDLPPSLLAARVEAFDGTEADGGEGCEAALPSGRLHPRDVVSLPQRLNCRNLVCVVDEFDRVEDAGTRTRLADTIKQLSDRGVALLFLIVGVSANLDEILGQHPSIQRAVLGVHLPLFSDRDVAQLIARGSRETGLSFPPAAIARITVLARGMPYMAQLLGLRITQAATERGDANVIEDDFDLAVVRLVEDAGPRVLALYAALTTHGRDAEMVLALRRIATAPQDPWGRLTVLDAGDGGVTVGGRSVSAACWEKLAQARVLEQTVPGSGLFVFGERALMHHALLLAARDSVLPASLGPESRSEPAPPGPEFRMNEPRTTELSEPRARPDDSHPPGTRTSVARTRLASMSRG